MAAINHGRPSPRNTFTELEPVMFVIDASACLLQIVACWLAKVSGRLVPNATNVMAVMPSSIPRTQPKSEARSPMKAVKIAMKSRAT